ncbi:MAG: hypothetical protein QG622_3599 [Actinomycetota bacterium]|nr:hypothetical protein [Actinomycetota bacterium]
MRLSGGVTVGILGGLTETADALSGGARPVLVEGPLDALAITLVGNDRYVGLAPLGTALTDTHTDLLRPYRGPSRPGVIVATDADPADLLHHYGPTALRQALDHPTDLVTHLIDQRLGTHTDTLRFAEGRIHVARTTAPLITALPLTEWMPLIEHVAARTGLSPVTVGLMAFDAGQNTSDILPARTPHARSAAAPEPRHLTPSKRPGGPRAPTLGPSSSPRSR